MGQRVLPLFYKLNSCLYIKFYIIREEGRKFCTSLPTESDVSKSPGLISEVDVTRFNSYPNLYIQPIINVSTESLLGLEMGTRVSARKSTSEKLEKILKVIIINNKGSGILGHRELIYNHSPSIRFNYREAECV